MSTAFGCPFNSMRRFVCSEGSVCSNSKWCLDYRLRSRGDVLSAFSASSAIVRRSGRQVLEYCSLARAATRNLFRYGSPILDKTCANECCTSTFGSFSSAQMSSCSYWKTAKSGAQTTAHDRLDRTYGNTVRPMRHLVDSPDEVPFPWSTPRTHQTSETWKISRPIG